MRSSRELRGIRLIPVSLLPSQVVANPPDTPEKRLCRAILEEALQSLRGSTSVSHGRHGSRNPATSQRACSRFIRRQQETARAWFLSDECSYAFAFVNVCAYLGYEPEVVREKLRVKSPEVTQGNTEL